MHGLTEDSSTIIGQETILGKDGSRICWVPKRNCKGVSSGDVVKCSNGEASIIADLDFYISFGTVVDLCTQQKQDSWIER